MRQTHPQLTGTIREKKNGQQLNKVLWKKAGEKVLNEIDPSNGPYTQYKNGLQFKYYFFYIKKSLANHILMIKIQKNVLFKKEVTQTRWF